MQSEFMRLIKRYPNRKLYDTQAKQYVTLDQLAALIRAGHDIQVVDYATGEDITSVTLTQIIFEKEKQHGDFLPRTVLTGLIKAGGETLGAMRQNLISSFGLLRQIDEEITRRVRLLASRGELAEEEAWRLLEKLLLEGDGLPGDAWTDENQLEQALTERGIPTRDDLQKIADQVEALAAKVDEFHSSD
jgi:polyhydroxyalkanoate synthesis repressor PhaR